MRTLKTSKFEEEIMMADGSKVVLLDMLSASPSIPDDEVERNIYRVSADYTVLWQIDVERGVYPRTPFTGIYRNEHAQIIAYRWDGTEYVVDPETGNATLYRFVK